MEWRSDKTVAWKHGNEGAELGFPSLAPAHYHGVQATGMRLSKQGLCWVFLVMQAANVFFQAKHPELCLIWSKATWTCFQKQWLVLLAAAPERPWCRLLPRWRPESWAITDAPNTSSLLIKVKEQQILYKRGNAWLFVRQSRRREQLQLNVFKSCSIKSKPANTILGQKLFFSRDAAVS